MKVSDLTVGVSIQGGSNVMNETTSHRESARWIGALEELINAQFVSQVDKKGEVFQITDEGYKFINK